MRDEQALRRPEFTDGPRVVLGDGQEWTFPRPSLRIHPRRDEGIVRGAIRRSHGEECDAKLVALLDCPEEETGQRILLQVELAGLLLLRNYDLDDDALEDLLTFDPSDTACIDRWIEIARAIGGVDGPKPSADGSA